MRNPLKDPQCGDLLANIATQAQERTPAIRVTLRDNTTVHYTSIDDADEIKSSSMSLDEWRRREWNFAVAPVGHQEA